MSISLVYTAVFPSRLTSPVPLENPVEIHNKNRILPIFEYLLEFINNNPLIKVGASIDNHFEIKFTDQTCLDLYLLDPRNLKTTIEAWLSDPLIIADCATISCVMNIEVIDNGPLSDNFVGIVASDLIAMLNWCSTNN